MSSYQFVNSLASCYGQQRGQESDYYTPQVQPYAATGCYSGPASPVQPYGGPYSQPAAHLQNGGAEHAGFAGCAQRLPGGGGGGGHPSPRTPTPSAASCKYAAPESTAASPQDLSASSTQSPSSPETRGSSPSPSPGQPAQGPPHSPPRSSAAQATPPAGTQQQQQSSSPQKPASYPANPPQIYPWMRKVHVGQSESADTRCVL